MEIINGELKVATNKVSEIEDSIQFYGDTFEEIRTLNNVQADNIMSLQESVRIHAQTTMESC